VPHALADDAPLAAQDEAESTEAATDETYEQQVLAYSKALGPYRDSLASFTQWCDEDASADVVLCSARVCF
jgi:hypothetical protein